MLCLELWTCTPQDLDEEEDANARKASRVDDAEAAVVRRAADAEEWRLQQLRTGQSDMNPNMQVVAKPLSTPSICAVCAVSTPEHNNRIGKLKNARYTHPGSEFRPWSSVMTA